jgi:hypothetical protein
MEFAVEETPACFAFFVVEIEIQKFGYLAGIAFCDDIYFASIELLNHPTLYSIELNKIKVISAYLNKHQVIAHRTPTDAFPHRKGIKGILH